MTRPAILVTGGAGYVGSHACQALAAAGWLPVVLDNLVHGHAEAVQWGPLEHGDIADRARLDHLLETYAPAAAMHFAAFTAVGESVADPGKYYRNNVAGSLTLLEALRDHGVGRIVFSSTAAVYGTPETVPIPEAAPKAPINPYGQTKLAVEHLLADFAAAHGIAATALRYFNAAGADRDGRIGERHDPETHLIPLALDAASGKGPPLKLFGDDYPTPDGTCIRDYIHVADLADAHVRALDAMDAFQAYNLGTGRGASVRQILDTVERVTGRAVPHDIAPRRPGDPPSLVADPSRAMAALGWKPKLSDLDTIVATAWAWHQRG
ncbi:UDP-glucose 4-epimerase GalE [Sphingomonas mesophila]|uniref:UDP-glucose 4-epimerase GalE n=1 Tax=Sphingomonas mesophila TaxID=2303576 RepID=UPI000E58D9D4|nr:UDP-glucose 4-epimerase GalE [Sphingomonas mesophila]